MIKRLTSIVALNWYIFRSRRLISSSLVYAVVLMLIVTIICSSLILMTLFHKIHFQNLIELNKLHSNVKSGLNLLLAETDLNKQDKVQNLSLFNGYNDSVELKWDQWGVFSIIQSRSWWKNIQLLKVALAGNYYIDDSSYALYLVDQDKPLSLCGKTRIIGNCYIPKSGVKPAYIESRGYESQFLIDGETDYSEDFFPELKEDISELDQTYFIDNLIESSDVLKYTIDSFKEDSLSNSFRNIPILLYSLKDIKLDNKNYKGNILVVCDGRLEISNTCHFSDIIIYAHSICIQDGFYGKLQLFGRDTINIGPDCKFDYPSVIGLVNQREEGQTGPSLIIIGESVDFTGIVFSSCNTASINIDPILILKNDVIFKGQIIWNGTLEIKGKIFGTIACKNILLRTPSSTYQNYLLDVEIDLSQLSENYTGVSLFPSIKPMKIVKWLN
jgi:hypothetical protein